MGVSNRVLQVEGRSLKLVPGATLIKMRNNLSTCVCGTLHAVAQEASFSLKLGISNVSVASTNSQSPSSQQDK